MKELPLWHGKEQFALKTGYGLFAWISGPFIKIQDSRINDFLLFMN